MKTAEEMAIETMNIYRNWSYQGKCTTATAEKFLEDTLTELYETQLKADVRSIEWHVTMFRDLMRWDDVLSIEQTPPPQENYVLIRNGKALQDFTRKNIAEGVLAILSARYLLRYDQRGEKGEERSFAITPLQVRSVARDMAEILDTNVAIWKRDAQMTAIWRRVEIIKADGSVQHVEQQ